MAYEKMTPLQGRSAAAVVAETGHRNVDTVGMFWALDDDAHDVHFRAAHDLILDVEVPRHRHTFEQVYFHLGGGQLMGKQRRPPGTFAYHPESVHYGPAGKEGEEPLEMIVCQFPAPSGKLFGSNQDVGRAMAALREQGATVERGLLVWPDGRRQDSTEAAFEWLLGGEIDYAPAVYDEPIVVHAPAMPWTPSTQPGVATKKLGSFGNTGPACRLVRIDCGAVLPSRVALWPEMHFLYEGSTEVNGTVYERVSAFYCPPGSSTLEMVGGDSGAQILSVAVDRRGSAAVPDASPW